ncbi:Cu(I)-responsive transcriptional regulator [Vibrio sp. TH_r3]|uniref:Cu(I)-responsive transcriptional regulator n=1 Tax=Vibrio sp. TH_r3 TaxID=3082084 RepID=UPI002954BACA|nr:Cu(I)-responsive transcriptional regulator [Vibrio sp. TH_r3]MDV7103252.1 Cu(I)-responsive transcriptional regulator [Vibrio sp. TH_r3]
MHINQVVKLTNLSAKSIRLYEQKGVISPPFRSDNGYRQYNQSHIEELQIIARAKRVGFTLDECKELVSLALNPKATSAEVKQKTQQKLQEVEQKLIELTEIKNQLERWVEACPGDEGNVCPIIDGLKS